jgi:hypothetical protein
MSYTTCELGETNVNDEDVIKAVRWRYRICNYLFNLGAAWFAVGTRDGCGSHSGQTLENLLE